MSMSRKKGQMELHNFYCTKCGKGGIPVLRPQGKKREALHLKKLYCIHCEQDTNHVEIAPNELYEASDFEKDFTLGKFKEIN